MQPLTVCNSNDTGCRKLRAVALQVVEETVADDDVVMVRGAANTRAVSVLLRGANDYMLDEMDRSLHDAFCIVKRVLESGVVVPGAQHQSSHAEGWVPCM